MKKVFLDCDVILDLLLERKEFVERSQLIFSLIDHRRINGYTSPLALANIYYIIRNLENQRKANRNIRKLSSLLSISTIHQKTVKEALNSSFKDFEDAIQNYSAIDAKVDYFITRNIRDYQSSTLSIMTPTTFLAAFSL